MKTLIPLSTLTLALAASPASLQAAYFQGTAYGSFPSAQWDEFHSASANRNDAEASGVTQSTPQGTSSSAAEGLVDYGRVVATARSSGEALEADQHYGATGTNQFIWSEQITISAPGRAGTSGRVKLRIRIDAQALAGTQGGVEPPAVDARAECTSTFEQLLSGSVAAQSYKVWQISKANQIGSQPLPILQVLDGYVVFGQAFEVRQTFVAHAAGSVSKGQTGSWQSSIRATANWDGILEVTDLEGYPIEGYTVTSETGIDYTQPLSGIASPFAAHALNNGWRVSPWLGWLDDRHYPWVYSLEHGWLYFGEGFAKTGVWIYSLRDGFGWFFTSDSLYPTHLFSPTHGWLLYYTGTGPGGVRWFYRWGTEPAEYLRFPAAP